MLRTLIFSAIAVAAISCSGGSPSAPKPVASTPPPAPAGSPTITITAAGMSPLELTIAIGQRVTFVNNDSRAHDAVGGQDPATPDCPEITQTGFLVPNDFREKTKMAEGLIGV